MVLFGGKTENKKIPRSHCADIGRAIHGEFLFRVFLFEICDTVAANLLASECYNIVCFAAENATGSVLLENNLILFYKNLNAVAGLDIH